MGKLLPLTILILLFNANIGLANTIDILVTVDNSVGVWFDNDKLVVTQEPVQIDMTEDGYLISF